MRADQQTPRAPSRRAFGAISGKTARTKEKMKVYPSNLERFGQRDSLLERLAGLKRRYARNGVFRPIADLRFVVEERLMNMLRLIVLFGIAACAYGQSNPVLAQFERLMGAPKNIVHALLDFPWKADLPDELPGLHTAARDRDIRIASVVQPLGPYSRWTHWENEDGTVWVDLATFSEPGRAAQLLRSARQPHSGYHWDNQLLLFSGTGDRRREAVGATLIRDGALLNIG